MNGLKFNFEWEDPLGAKGPELRATWARLQILVGDTSVTRVVDSGSRSVRDAVYCPLYPLAEWLATHWWFLLHEVEAPCASRQESYRERHSLAHAREGYALPDLELCPESGRFLLRWEARSIPNSRVQFLEKGSAVLDTHGVRDELERFIGSVRDRLDAEGVRGTLLQEEWAAIDRCDAKERRFCEVTAAMGLDPYSLDNSVQDQIIDISRKLPDSLTDDFFSITELPRMADDVRLLLAELTHIRQLPVALPALIDLRRHHPPIDPSLEPWRQGYDFARALRAQLGMNGNIPNDMAGTGRSLGLDATSLEQAILPGTDGDVFFDALVGVNAQGSPGFAIPSRRATSRRFTFCRSLFEYLNSPDDHSPSLISAARSHRQKRNRAFAAEFLAPASLIRERIHRDIVDEDQVNDLADEFGVSQRVITHQIENQRLATIASTL